MDRLIEALRNAPGPDGLLSQAVAHRAAHVLRPTRALARFDEVAVWLAGWQRTDCPEVRKPVCVLAAGDHGVVGRGVSAYPPEVTSAMVDAIRAGVATSVVVATEVGAVVRLVDAGVGRPTGDITEEDALSPQRFQELIELGRTTVDELDTDLLLLGEMGIGNTTAAAAVAAALHDGPSERWVGRGAGLDEEGMVLKRNAVDLAAERVRGDRPLEILRRVGGSELAVLAGAVVQARVRSLPVLLDGYVTTAAVAPLAAEVPGSINHCFASHVSPEPGHRLLLDELELKPLLDLDLALGEGSGALAALPLVRVAAAAVVDVATFEEWGL